MAIISVNCTYCDMEHRCYEDGGSFNCRNCGSVVVPMSRERMIKESYMVDIPDGGFRCKARTAG